VSGRPDLERASLEDLARRTHAAEARGDDIEFLAVQAEVESRPASNQECYRRHWIRQMRNRFGNAES
jgi:hypothetical protein